MRSAIGELSGSNPPAEAANAITAFGVKLAAVGGNGGGGGRGGGGGGRGGAAAGPPPAPNFAASIGAMNRELEGLDAGDQAPTEPMLRTWRWACDDLSAMVKSWNGINGGELTTFNALLAKNGLEADERGEAGAADARCVRRGAAAKH